MAAKLGSGARFQALTAKLSRRKDVQTPKALAAWIGRRKYGAHRMAELAAMGRRAMKRHS